MGWTSGTAILSPSTSPTGYRRTGALYENYIRPGSVVANNAALTLGTLLLVAIDLPAGALIASVTFVSGTQALVAGTSPHLWAVLANSSRVVKAVTVDMTTAGEPVWAASSEKPFTFVTPYTTTYAGIHYVGVAHMGTTATAPSLQVVAGGALLNGLGPIIAGASNTTITTPPALADTLTAITAGTAVPYCWVA